MRKLFILSFLILFCATISAQQQEIKLWKIHNQKYYTTLYCYHAPDSINTGVAVIVCPGGSYRHLMGIKTEGYEVAEWLNSQGINAYVLRYRVGKYGYHHPAMIEDFQLAIQFLRENAVRWHLDSTKISAMGFSAGGHLVTMAGAFGNQNFLQSYNIVAEHSNRPDFVVPVYPVVSMQDDIAHQRSRKNLLTKHYTKEQQDKFSMEMQIPNDMPPTFLVTAKDDPVVMYQNSIKLDEALTAKNISHVFKLFETGGHGYGMSEEIAPDAGRWKYDFLIWLRELNILSNKK